MKITLSQEEILQIVTEHVNKQFTGEWRTDESYQICGDISFWEATPQAINEREDAERARLERVAASKITEDKQCHA